MQHPDCCVRRVKNWYLFLVLFSFPKLASQTGGRARNKRFPRQTAQAGEKLAVAARRLAMLSHATGGLWQGLARAAHCLARHCQTTGSVSQWLLDIRLDVLIDMSIDKHVHTHLFDGFGL